MYRLLPTTYVARGKVVFSLVCVILFTGGGRVHPVQVLPCRSEGTSCPGPTRGRGKCPVHVLLVHVLWSLGEG